MTSADSPARVERAPQTPSPPVLSPIDSRRFGINVARADDVRAQSVPELLWFAEENDVDLLITRCDGADAQAERALLGAGWQLLEAQIFYRGPLAPRTRPANIREGRPGDEAAIAQLAREAFRDLNTHYHADPRLPGEACLELYVDWTLRGLAGEAADVFYVVEEGEGLAGFGMFGQTGREEIRYILAGVVGWAQGRGLYLGLLDRGMRWGSDRGADAVLGVVPHGNIPAHRNLIEAGLRPVSSTSTFHGWRDQIRR